MSKDDTAQLTRADYKKVYKLVGALPMLVSGLIGLSLGPIALALSNLPDKSPGSENGILLLLGVGILILALAVAVISYKALTALEGENDEEKEV